MSTREPRHDGAPDFDLDSAIRALRVQHGSEAQALALEQRLVAKLGPTALATTGAGAGGATWGGWLLLLVGLGGAGFLALRAHDAVRDAVEQREAESTLRAEPHAQSVLRSDAAEPAVQAVAEPTLSSAPEPARPVRRARRRPAAEPAPLAAAPAAAPQDELRLLQRSRAALRGDPRAALALAEQHAREFPNGLFVQEREVLAIEALLRQRDRGAAIARAEQFVAGHGDSPYALRIRAMLEQLPRGEPSAVRGAASAEAFAP